jgi:hypothetical protein
MAEVVYLLCALTSLSCAMVLWRNWRRARLRIVLWTSVCFAALALQNVLLFVDLVVVGPSIQLSPLRNGIGLAGLSILLYGLLTEALGRER